jgi:hypothetical protein
MNYSSDWRFKTVQLKVEQELDFSLDRYLACFGQYRRKDPICRTRCVMNLRCAIEKEQNERFEILEDLVSTGGMVIKVN